MVVCSFELVIRFIGKGMRHRELGLVPRHYSSPAIGLEDGIYM